MLRNKLTPTQAFIGGLKQFINGQRYREHWLAHQGDGTMPSSSLMSRFCVTLAASWYRWWPLDRGKRVGLRLGRIGYRLGIATPCWINRHGSWLWADIRDYTFCQLALHGSYEPEIAKLIDSHLPPKGIFIDVGANLGYHSLTAARKAERVIAIEPCARIAGLLAQSATRNGAPNITVVNKACSDELGTASLFESPKSNQGKNSLSSANACSTVAHTVEADTVDDLVEQHELTRVDVVKIDTEGFEFHVLRGMTRTIRRFHPAIIIELDDKLLRAFGTTTEEISAYLALRGYRRHPITPSDFLFN